MNKRLDLITPDEVLDESRVEHVALTMPVLVLMVCGTIGSTVIAYALTRSIDVALLSAYGCFAVTAWHAGKEAAINRKELIIALLRVKLVATPANAQRKLLAPHLESISKIHRREVEIETKIFPGMLTTLAVLQSLILLDTSANIALRSASAVAMLMIYVVAFHIGRERWRFQRRVRRLRASDTFGMSA